jgi:hypothetical protein
MAGVFEPSQSLPWVIFFSRGRTRNVIEHISLVEHEAQLEIFSEKTEHGFPEREKFSEENSHENHCQDGFQLLCTSVIYEEK